MVREQANRIPPAASAPVEAAEAAILVDSPAALAEARDRWSRVPALALDTEFVRERTFYPCLGLIQVSDGTVAWLVDPLAVEDLAPLEEVLQNPRILKVLHSASEDLEVFYHRFGSLPRPIFDTQVAAALAGYGASLSYQRLVATLFEVKLEKGETRTDWLARPLSEAQLAYAVEDVAYLLPVYARLREELAAMGRLPWLEEDCITLLDPSRFELDPEMAYLRVKGVSRLNRRQLGVLQALAAWREREARRRNLPRNFVLRENLMVSLARVRPRTLRDLHRLPHLDRRQAATGGPLWLELLREASRLPEEELPPLPEPPVPASQAKDLEDRLLARVRERAQELKLPPEVLASRRTLKALVRSALTQTQFQIPPELQGWRWQLLGEALLAELESL